MVEVLINGTSIDLISKGVKYTKQANDLADISTVNTSFTYTIRADKTPKNTRLFQQLGMVGDTSTVPYRKNVTQLIDNGAVLISKGISTVKETSDDYKLFIQDGIVEVFKLIENRSLGYDLDLSELSHSKNATTIIESWGSQNPQIEDPIMGFPYRYLIADYNGKTNEGNAIDAAYQIPSVNVKYLWDKVFDFMGYTYSGDFNFIEDKWITYPKPPEVEDEEISEILNVSIVPYIGSYPSDAYKQWQSPIVQGNILLLNNWRIRANVTGNYRFTFSGEGFAEVETYRTNIIPFMIRLFISGQPYYYIMSDNPGEVTFDAFIPADAIIELKIEVDTSQIQGAFTLDGIVIDRIDLKLETTSRENIDFSGVLADFSITDFFKEVMIRGALTPFPDNITRHIEFKNLTERLKIIPGNIVNISDKYVKRNTETYTFGTYAQKNLLKLKYNNAEETYNNGFISVENKNIDDEKVLFDSKFFTPDQGLVDLLVNLGNEIETPLVRMWQKEIKEKDGVQEIEYKPLNSRFYYLSGEKVNQTITVNTQSAGMFYKASTKDTTMHEVAQSKYNQIPRIFTDTRIHEIDLALSAYDFQALDMSKLYYLEQEGQFYILNRVIWESGKLSKGEFLRVKKV